MEHSREPELKNLIIKGKRQGFLTYEEINDHLPDRLSDVEHVESIVNMLNEMEVEVLDAPPDPDSLILNAEESMDEENVAEEAEEVLKSEFGSTTDPVRMYMREMGAIDLLTRDKEIELAKRIQSGLQQAKEAVSTCPLVFDRLIWMFDRIQGESMRVTELFTGFISDGRKKRRDSASTCLKCTNDPERSRLTTRIYRSPSKMNLTGFEVRKPGSTEVIWQTTFWSSNS